MKKITVREVANSSGDSSVDYIWLVVSTQLKNISQNGNLPQIVVKIKHT